MRKKSNTAICATTNGDGSVRPPLQSGLGQRSKTRQKKEKKKSRANNGRTKAKERARLRAKAKQKVHQEDVTTVEDLIMSGSARTGKEVSRVKVISHRKPRTVGIQGHLPRLGKDGGQAIKVKERGSSMAKVVKTEPNRWDFFFSPTRNCQQSYM